MATERYIRIKMDAKQAIRENRRLQGSLNKTEGAARRLGGGLTAIASGVISAVAVKQVAAYADAWTNVQNQLRQVTKTSTELKNVTAQLFAVAQGSRSSLEATADLYSKLSRSLEGAGVSSSRLVEITDTVNKIFASSGASAQEASNAIRQLGQGLASGALRGDEFNSVAEQAPGILRAVAAETGKSVGELREFAAQGKITTELLVRSLENYRQTALSDFGKTNATIGQSTTILSNSITKLAGSFDEVTGASTTAAGGILAISSALDELSEWLKTDEYQKLEALFVKAAGSLPGFNAVRALAGATGVFDGPGAPTPTFDQQFGTNQFSPLDPEKSQVGEGTVLRANDLEASSEFFAQRLEAELNYTTQYLDIINNRFVAEQELRDFDKAHYEEYTDNLIQFSSDRLNFDEEAEHQRKLLMLGATSDALTIIAAFGRKSLKLQKAIGLAKAGVAIAEGVAEAQKLTWPLNLSETARILSIGASVATAIQGASIGNANLGSLTGATSRSAAPQQPNLPQAPQQVQGIDFGSIIDELRRAENEPLPASFVARILEQAQQARALTG